MASNDCRRPYVSETRTDHAQVNLGTVVDAEHKSFSEQTGIPQGEFSALGTGVGADAMLSPKAGMCQGSKDSIEAWC